MKAAALSKTEKNIAEFLPYTRFVDNKTLRTKDGYLLQIIKLHGIAFETEDQSDIEHFKDVRATFLRGLASPRFAIYHHIIRREIKVEQDSFFENDFCRALDRAYHETLAHKRMFINEQYITVALRPEQGAIGIAAAIGRTFAAKLDKKLYAQKITEDQKFLNNTVKSLLTTLSSYDAKVLEIEERDGGIFSPALSFLSYLLNIENVSLRLPRCGINKYLPRKRLSFGKETFEVRGSAPSDIKLGAMLSLKDYPDGTSAGMLDGLLKLPHEFVLTQSYACVDRQTALLKIRDVKRKMMAGEEGAVTLEDELEIAIDKVASGLSSFGEHHASICVTEKSTTGLEQAISACINAFVTLGIIAVREDLNMEPAFWAQFPGNFSYISRKSMISNQNFSGFASFHNFPVGQKNNNHWGEAVSVLETTSGTPYYFNFHERDVGNFTLFGPTGYGKTILMTFLHAQSQKFSPKSIFFDKDRGAEIYMRAIGGQYNIVKAGMPSGLNPLQLEDSPENRAFLRNWLQILIRGESQKDFTAKELDIIADAVTANYDAPPEHRKLSVLSKLFGGFESLDDETLMDRLSMWHSGGERAWLFDNETDTLSLDQKTIGFDMTSILDDPVNRTPWLYYIFHRIQSSLNGQKAMIMLDEGWKLLDDPVFSANIKDWLKTIRKSNGLVGFATQSISDAINSRIGETILEQCPTQIFLPNPKAREEDYCGHFQLTKQELHMIRNLTAQSRCFLIKHAQDSVIARLDLSGMDGFISVLSGRAENTIILDGLRKNNPDPDIWLPQFLKKVAA
ncbi:MAG: VirB4 family type IV secretion/conjugal transfer ATPase [Alphaproteobacteria bacterium]|nr:VirB4 family type IV secretion/conjugal transfer ATPase [Alphaproteobacteria bacterium]